MGENISKLEKLIASSYGSEDLEFANHTLDIDSARDALTECKEQGVGFKEYIELHKAFLEGKGCPPEHIAEQLEEVQNLRNYFNND